MKKLTTLSICLLLLLVYACQTEEIETSIAQNNQVDNQSNDASDDDDDDEDETEEDSCETLFAIGGEDNSTCFLDDGFNRWGWTIGPISSGDYSFDLYAGAGQCDTDKGTLVGTLDISYNETTDSIDVDFNMSEGYVLNETHLYIGEDAYPTGQNGENTVAPGQYPYKNDDLDNTSSDSYSISEVSGEIYVIAHGVVCDDEHDDDDDDDNGGAF